MKRLLVTVLIAAQIAGCTAKETKEKTKVGRDIDECYALTGVSWDHSSDSGLFGLLLGAAIGGAAGNVLSGARIGSSFGSHSGAQEGESEGGRKVRECLQGRGYYEIKMHGANLVSMVGPRTINDP